MLSLFQMCMTTGWTVLMYKGVDSTKPNYMPIKKKNIYISIFFIFFIMIGAFFIVNMFVGVVISTFNREKENMGRNVMLSKHQREWIDTKLVVIKTKPMIRIKEPGSCFRKFFFKLAVSKRLDNLITVFIVLNTILLTLDYYDEPDALHVVTSNFNNFFAAIFTLEAVIKIIGMGK